MVMKLFCSALLFALWMWEILLLRDRQVFSHIWVTEMDGLVHRETQAPCSPHRCQGYPLSVAVTAPGQSTPKLTRPLGSQGGDNHQPGDMIPLRSWTFNLPCRVSLPCNDIASHRKGFSCLARFQLLCLYSRNPRAWLTVLRWSCSPTVGLRGSELWPCRNAAISLVLKWAYKHLTPSG